ncbi:hypothetical protein [Alkalihalobacillus sp. BA299]|uniref:hypothetical protein n=1 Tax=Alkalihalobacillus sp. BA299 TaxID=2815938 RepID=UPI001ADA86E1|nr:hypothetical protein [Alkalihalobacillus sp. BA299]
MSSILVDIKYMSWVLANANNNLPNFIKDPKENNHVIEKKDTSDLLGFSQSFDSWIGPVYNFGINMLTILFIAAIISMAFAIITKTGQWMKWATGTMVFSFIALLILRIGPIIFLTTNAVGITLIVSDTVGFLKAVSFWAAIGMILVGLYIRLLHKVVSDHPEYFRWSKGLFVGALILGVLSGVIPLLFKVV